MTNRIAVVLVLLIALGFGYDMLRNDGAALLFLARKFMGLIEYLAFWR